MRSGAALSTGILARRAGVSKQTIRYYERIGLIEPTARNESNYRLYAETVVDRIRFIKKAQELGFQLREIEELLQLRIDGRSNCDQVRTKAKVKLDDVRRRISDLRRLERVLGRLVESCINRSPTGACPILAAIDQEQKQ